MNTLKFKKNTRSNQNKQSVGHVPNCKRIKSMVNSQVAEINKGLGNENYVCTDCGCLINADKPEEVKDGRIRKQRG